MPDVVLAPGRPLLAESERAALTANGALVVDDGRRRTRYFDGRFLDAAALARDQRYVEARRLELGSLLGPGIVRGLEVSLDGDTLTVAPGLGLVPGGAVVELADPLVLRLRELAPLEQLDVAFGLARRARPRAKPLSGLFVLALRPVAFTANPVAVNPDALTDPRRVEDGDVVEAVAATLVPFSDSGLADGDETLVRRSLQRRVFDATANLPVPADALPVAVLALERGVVRWLDVELVRREADGGDTGSLGLEGGHGLRRALAAHYAARVRALASEGRLGAAAEHFALLPAAGPVPLAAIDTERLTQRWFPPEVRVSLRIVPEDELSPLLEESTALPPIDLGLAAPVLSEIALAVLVPVPRRELTTLAGTLAGASEALPPAGGNVVRGLTPLEQIRGLALGRRLRAPVPAGTATGGWSELLRGRSELFYVRLPAYGSPVTLTDRPRDGRRSGAPGPGEADAPDRRPDLGSTEDGDSGAPGRGTVSDPDALFERARADATVDARREIDRFLATDVVRDQPLVATATARALAPLDRPRARETRAALAPLDGVGDGLARLRARDEALLGDAEVARVLGTPAVVARLDAAAVSADEAELDRVLAVVRDAAATDDPDAARVLVEDRLAVAPGG